MPDYGYEQQRRTMHDEWLDYAEGKRAFKKQLEAIQHRNIMEQIERRQAGQTQRQNIATQGALKSTALDVAGRKDIASMLGERELRKLAFEHGSPEEAAKYRSGAQTLVERGVKARELQAETQASEEARLSESEQYYRDLMKGEDIPSTSKPKMIPTDEEDIENVRKMMRNKKRLDLSRQF